LYPANAKDGLHAKRDARPTMSAHIVDAQWSANQFIVIEINKSDLLFLEKLMIAALFKHELSVEPSLEG
jgi:hypothetical protein